MPIALSPARRQELKGRAHALDPVVLIGAGGLTPTVLAEVNRALDSHELIKIRVAHGDRRERERILSEVCAAADAAPVQHIGKILVVFRERPEKPAPEKPAKSPKSQRNPPRRASPRRPEVRTQARPRHTSSSRRGKLRPR